MKRLNYHLFATLPFALALAACGSNSSSVSGGGGSISVDSGGNCSQRYINDYNKISSEARQLKSMTKNPELYPESRISAQLDNIHSACKLFFATHANVTCRAEVDFSTKTVSSDDHRTGCATVEKFFETKKKAAPQISSSVSMEQTRPAEQPAPMAVTVETATVPAPAPAPVTEDSIAMSELRSEQIQITIRDQAAFAKLLKSKHLGVANGTIDEESRLLNYMTSENAACFVNDQAKPTKKKDKVSNLEMKSQTERTDSYGKRELSLELNNGRIAITCHRTDNAAFKLSAVRSAFGGILEFNILK
ncbi:MAG: hypothetical protein JNJ49_09545 [Bdellovibrionaceae bacterium]|nr:hypothetical protein [Pseudobdellovibrionaceae bacterium]